MMPTRYLKPGICDSESIDKCSPLAETLFYRLLVNVDDYGRIDARPILIKSKCFPLKEEITSQQVDGLLCELSNNGLLIVYQKDGRAYLQMRKWDNKPRATESKCPPLGDDCIQLYTDVNNPHTNLPVTVTETVNRKPEPKHKAPATPLPDWLQPSAWDDFQAHRKAMKSAMTPRAQTLAINELDTLRRQGHDPTQVINQSIQRGWKGLFAISNGNGNGQPKGQSYHERLAETAAALTGRGKPRPNDFDSARVIDGETTRLD